MFEYKPVDAWKKERARAEEVAAAKAKAESEAARRLAAIERDNERRDREQYAKLKEKFG